MTKNLRELENRKMVGLRISKYDPSRRSQDGYYREDDWTSVSDIGGTFGGKELTAGDYMLVEDAYVEAVKHLMALAGVGSLRVSGLETHGSCDNLPPEMVAESRRLLKRFRPDRLLEGEDLESAVRLVLREVIWCKLVGENGFCVHFAFDYYMYIWFQGLDVRKARVPAGLYAEESESPLLENE